MKSFLSTFLLGGSLILLLASCNKTSNTTIAPTSNHNAHVQFIHASPSKTGLKPWFNQVSVLDVGRYFKSNTHYFPIHAGHNQIAIKQASSGLLLNEKGFDMLPGQYYSLFAADSMNKLIPVLVPDYPLNTIANKAQVRFINLVSNTHTINISYNALPSPLKLSYKQTTSYSYINPGALSISVTDAATGQVILPSVNAWFDANRVYTIYITGYPDQGGAQGVDAILMGNL